MDGILIIDKEAGMTSHDVVSRVRKILGTRRVGHTGTLDPFATGVLVLVVGKATRLARFLDKDIKEYVADLQFGFETDTGDRTGLRISDCGLRIEEVVSRLGDTDWESVFKKFRGEVMQTPPMYSAKKIEGKKLYELARKGVDVERKPVLVSIQTLELLPEEFRSSQSAIRIRVVCSAGTYIRQLAEDIGREVGTGAHLTELRRTAAGRFTLDQAITLEELADSTQPSALCLPIDDAVSHLPEFKLPEDRVEATRNGLTTRVHETDLQDGKHVRMTNGNGEVVAVGVYSEGEKAIHPKIVLI